MGEMKAVVTPKGVTLTWAPGVPTGNEGQPTSYNILRTTTQGGENGTPIASVPATETTYTDTTGTPDQEYWYEIVAVNSAGSSAPSNEVSATFLVPVQVPAAPIDLVATVNP